MCQFEPCQCGTGDQCGMNLHCVEAMQALVTVTEADGEGHGIQTLFQGHMVSFFFMFLVGKLVSTIFQVYFQSITVLHCTALAPRIPLQQ